MVSRFADCFIDRRCLALVEHLVPTLVGLGVFGIALGYKELDDRDDSSASASLEAYAAPKMMA
ncbi:hypothetical protein IVB22_34425 [Bradyrhizobium sp. 190]|uniref:transposase n=1 Tax=Bradyrhizobium sp. 190 TaxID=2782658 RepID=UPI001FF752D5|nr:transposase [Bradyrhizobium sp. 190]MCK1517515.1 hypothetical protein [Bradyrhizobium sp. 190]